MQTVAQPTPRAWMQPDSEIGFLMRLFCDTFSVERERFGIPEGEGTVDLLIACRFTLPSPQTHREG